MESSTSPSSHMAVWPKLRRLVKECKARKGKSKQNSYVSRGLEVVAVVYEELRARGDSMAEKIGAPVSMVRSISQSARSRSTSSNVQISKNSVSIAKWQNEESVPVVVGFDSISEEKISKSGGKSAVKSRVESVEASVQGRNDVTNAVLSSRDNVCDSHDSLARMSSSVELALVRDTSFENTFSSLDLRGTKNGRTRSRSLCGQEKRWRHLNRKAVAFIIILGVFFSKIAADLRSTVLGALFLGVTIRWRRGKQQLLHLFSAIVKFLQGPLFSHLSRLATKRLDTEAAPLTIPEQNSTFVFPVISPNVSTPSPRMCAFFLSDPIPFPPVANDSKFHETLSAPVSPALFPKRCAGSPISLVERSPSPTHKLSDLKSKLFKSLPRNKAPSNVTDRAFSMPASPTCEGYQESFPRFERWDSGSSSSTEVVGVRSLENRVLIKKSFLQRRSQTKHDDGGADISDSRSSSFCRSRFGNLRINISHSHDDSNTTAATNTPRTLRIGKLRISTSMKDSPRSEHFDNSRPCSPSQEKLKVSFGKLEGLKTEPSTPRPSGLGVVTRSPGELQERIALEAKKRDGHEAWLAMILLVVLIFLVLGRVPAVLATSVSFLLISQLDKFKYSGREIRDRDASRRAMEASRKLKRSPSPLSPPLGSPRSPRSPCSGSPRISLARVFSNDYRKSISLDNVFKKGRKSGH